MVSDMEYLPPLGESDHICISFNLRCNQQTVGQEQERLNVFKTDYGAVTEELSKWNWVELLNSTFEEEGRGPVYIRLGKSFIKNSFSRKDHNK